jgi:hypothetical protein
MDRLNNFLTPPGVVLISGPIYIWTGEGNGGKSHLTKYLNLLGEEERDQIINESINISQNGPKTHIGGK